jgi:predicted aldo/keto reductase-like oxidoreductase
LDHLSEPFKTVNDQRFDFLSNFVTWIENWQKLSHKFKGHILSPDTSKALIQSTNALSCIIRYCLETIKVPYVLPGKFQTDKLEKRFSMCRQFNGSNYNVSVTQVMETEKKTQNKKCARH